MEEELTQPTPIQQALEPDQGSSLLDQLAAKRQAVNDTKETFIPLPGYDKNPPILLAKYRLLDGTEIARVADKTRTEFRNRWERQIYSAVDIFTVACIGIYYDLEEGEGPQPLTVQGVPVMGFTSDLAEGLKFADKLEDPNDQRQVVFGLFGNNDVMIGQHSFALQRWFGDTTQEVTSDLLGNL